MTIILGIIGRGLVGKELIEQLIQWAKRSDAKGIKLCGVCDSKKMFLAELGVDWSWSSISQTLESSSAQPLNLDEFANKISEWGHTGDKQTNTKGNRSVIVDCTASEHVSSMYVKWLSMGIHIATPNKKAFSSDLQVYKNIISTCQQKGVYCMHEATVGAGLPVISTLQDMVDTGDKVVKIEGILSGTLSYIFNNFVEGQKFSEIVKQAKSLGYTEPDPRDDLNGMDFARKVLILSRVAGFSTSISDLKVQNIVPEELRLVPTADDFVNGLPKFDGYFEKLNAEALQEGKVLRYVGVINSDGSCSVELKKYPKSHPFASLKGSDNVISFTTQRYPNSLIIQGSGAGAAVTAAGVLSDLLKIFRSIQ